jgi:GNAT superfamily N-acetyltransferase
MPPITNLPRVRAILDSDRPWAAYALGDLSPHLVGKCTWFAPGDGSPTLAMLYRGFEPPIAFAMGDAADLRPLVHEFTAPVISLHIRPEVLATLEPDYRPTSIKRMWRMVVDASSFRPVPTTGVVVVEPPDLAAVNALYDEGRKHGEGPTFFHPSMLAQGTFRAVVEGSDFIAIAGSHVYSIELGVCTIGNVYTRRDCRRRGLGARVTAAVVETALADDVQTIVLNVSQENTGARRVYEQLGFRTYCEFLEGEAVRDDTKRSGFSEV